MKLLMVITSHDALGDTGMKTGMWLEEVAAPYVLVNGTTLAGVPRVAVRSVTGFANMEEHAAGLTTVITVLIEDMLKDGEAGIPRVGLAIPRCRR